LPDRASGLGVFVICADSDAEAQLLAQCRDLWRLRVERGEFGPFPSPAEALAYEMTPARRRIGSRREHQILGTRKPASAVSTWRELRRGRAVGGQHHPRVQAARALLRTMDADGLTNLD
jgi:alkanesulfonate monooxygenase SsuD/methylene tetrahydromethanopterin reductase-like flavin-dependent oxidoreductase (luciferase family)